MEFLLLMFAIFITLISFFSVVVLAIFPYLWFKDYLHMQKVREQKTKETFGKEFLNKDELKSRHPRLRAISEQVLLFIFTWLPFLIIEILWVRYIYRTVIDVVYARIMELIPL